MGGGGVTANYFPDSSASASDASLMPDSRRPHWDLNSGWPAWTSRCFCLVCFWLFLYARTCLGLKMKMSVWYCLFWCHLPFCHRPVYRICFSECADCSAWLKLPLYLLRNDKAVVCVVIMLVVLSECAFDPFFSSFYHRSHEMKQSINESFYEKKTNSSVGHTYTYTDARTHTHTRTHARTHIAA